MDVTCRCDTVRLRIDVPDPSVGTRIKCYCTDCQTAAHHLKGSDDTLDAAGGTDVWQTTPDRLQILAGVDHIGILRLSPNGIFRWYATCCDTPLCNTLPRVGVPYVGVVLREPVTSNADSTLGAVQAHVNTAGARRGKGAPTQDKKFARAGINVLWRMALTLLSGNVRRNALLGKDGAPIAPITVLSLEARNAARPNG